VLFVVTVGWLVLACSLLGSSTSLARWCPNFVIAGLQLTLPWTALWALAVTVAAAILGERPLAFAGAATVVLASTLLVPKAVAHPDPPAAGGGIALTIVLANLYLANPEPDRAIGQLLASGADVLVMTELTPQLVATFDRLGGAAAFPARVHPDPIDGEYALGVFSRRPLGDARIEQHQLLRVVVATWARGGSSLTIRAVHPDAPSTRAGFRRWRRQLATLRGLDAQSTGPTIVIGDLNGGSFQVPYERLLRGRFRDAHMVLGRALTPSWGVAAWLPRWVPTLVARLDHLLVSPEIRVVDIGDLDPVGSDHRPLRAVIQLP